MTKPTIPEVLPIARRYVAKHPAGGSLHIVLDDGNFRDSSVECCEQDARDRGDSDGEELAKLLRKMSKTQRRKIAALAYGPAPT